MSGVSREWFAGGRRDQQEDKAREKSLSAKIFFILLTRCIYCKKNACCGETTKRLVARYEKQVFFGRSLDYSSHYSSALFFWAR